MRPRPFLIDSYVFVTDLRYQHDQNFVANRHFLDADFPAVPLGEVRR